jgi:hypothetical protein
MTTPNHPHDDHNTHDHHQEHSLFEVAKNALAIVGAYYITKDTLYYMQSLVLSYNREVMNDYIATAAYEGALVLANLAGNAIEMLKQISPECAAASVAVTAASVAANHLCKDAECLSMHTKAVADFFANMQYCTETLVEFSGEVSSFATTTVIPA